MCIRDRVVNNKERFQSGEMTPEMQKKMKKEARKGMFQTLGRLLKYVTGIYKFQFFVVLIGIVVSAFGQVLAIMEMRYLIDDYIVPFIGQKDPDLSGMTSIIVIMALSYGCLLYTSRCV